MGGSWGKQIAVEMSAQDEREFIAWLRSTAPVQILAMNVPASAHVRGPEDLVLDELPPARDGGYTRFAIWNQNFAWIPQLRDTDAAIINADRGPVIQYTRRWYPKGVTRLFWARSISGDGPYEYKKSTYSYDAAAFEPWWKEVSSWVKERAAVVHRRPLGNLYVLPDAARPPLSPLERLTAWLRRD